MKMENNIDSGQGSNNLIISFVGIVFTWTLKDVQNILALVATLVTIISGCLAARYYYKKTKNEK